MLPPLRRWLRKVLPRLLALGAPLFRGPRILTYHRVAELRGDRLSVPPRRFAEQLHLLRELGYRVVRLEELVSALEAGASMDSRLVALSFDDGYRDNYTQAWPVLRRFGVPATVFVVTDWIGTELVFSRYERWDPTALPLDWRQVAQMKEGGVGFGSHTRTHPILPELAPERLREEILGSRQELGHRLGEEVQFFCYPRGALDPDSVRLVREAGYRAACSTLPGPNRSGVDRFRLRRTEISGDDRAEDFVAKLRGGFDLWHALLQRRRSER